MTTNIENTSLYKLDYHRIETTFPGCRCRSGCDCKSNYTPFILEHYTVLNKKNKVTSRFKKLEKAQKRIETLKEYYDYK